MAGKEKGERTALALADFKQTFREAVVRLVLRVKELLKQVACLYGPSPLEAVVPYQWGCRSLHFLERSDRTPQGEAQSDMPAHLRILFPSGIRATLT